MFQLAPKSKAFCFFLLLNSFKTAVCVIAAGRLAYGEVWVCRDGAGNAVFTDAPVESAEVICGTANLKEGSFTTLPAEDFVNWHERELADTKEKLEAGPQKKAGTTAAAPAVSASGRIPAPRGRFGEPSINRQRDVSGAPHKRRSARERSYPFLQ
jgi:hypothetical protein